MNWTSDRQKESNRGRTFISPGAPPFQSQQPVLVHLNLWHYTGFLIHGRQQNNFWNAKVTNSSPPQGRCRNKQASNSKRKTCCLFTDPRRFLSKGIKPSAEKHDWDGLKTSFKWGLSDVQVRTHTRTTQAEGFGYPHRYFVDLLYASFFIIPEPHWRARRAAVIQDRSFVVRTYTRSTHVPALNAPKLVFRLKDV